MSIVETKYTPIDREELARLRADSAELARVRAEPDYGVFIGYLLDKCEREVIYEESLQRWMADMIADPHYSSLFRREKQSHPSVTEQPVNVPEGFALVPVDRLKHVHRDLDACQRVIWYAGGFDPAYCKDAQARLAEIDAWLAAAPKGGSHE